MAEVQLSPALRFPEFEEEWREKKLGTITLKVGSGKTPRGGEKVYQTNGIPFIRSQNVLNDQLVLDEVHIPEEVHEEMKGSSVQPEDILLNITGGSIGRSCVVPKEFREGNVNQHVSIIRLKEDNPYFLQSILSSWRGQKLIYQGQTGSGREGLNFESIKGFKITFPSLPEQQKIAAFLTAVDQRIQLLQQKKAKLEEYKKGVMQKLFSQEIRFKPAPSGVEGDENGNDFPDWEEKKLGEIVHIKMGQSPKSSSYNSNRNGMPLIQGNADIVNRTSEPRQYTSEPTKICKKGDLLMTVRAPVGYIGKSLHLACIGRGVCAISSKVTSDLSFIYQFLLWFEPKWISIGQGSTFTAISSSDISKLNVVLPSLPEQQKIASFLSSLDESIVSVAKQIEATTTFKKGLLQKMFV